jgi:hypothetical protein
MQTGFPFARVTQLHVALPGHAGALVQMSPPAEQTDAVVVDVVVLELVVVVAETHTEAVPNEAAVGHPPVHACPAGQHVRLAPLPQGVVRGGQPQSPLEASMQATPVAQQFGPHGVVAFGQQHSNDGFEQVPPLGQQPVPQTGLPVGQVTAPPWKGRSTTAPAAARAVAPITFSAPRREVGLAIDLVRSSKRSVISHLPACRTRTALHIVDGGCARSATLRCAQ